ncbi:hypothetical protein GDO86_001813 [Hymenochirus boettgeri]|uniref:Olfactory receptor n=1 Tax=Hymenochirus boettgeri TaxID=247094 RepID=A0A8T2KHI3_9PIPI|nr:hypothetical protein GDO86_001813 [Hymenochirus boettgeri]
MINDNNTVELILIGFSSLPLVKMWLTPALLLVYGFTIVENVFLIVLVRVSPHLHTPMYFFLGHFSFLECWYTTTIIPKTLHILITGNTTILFTTCIAQLYVFISLGATECLFLATMAYDRYVAICYPLHYSVMIRNKLCILLVLCSWIGGFLTPVLPTVFVSKLPFCKFLINHFFCDFPALLQLSCAVTSHAKLSLSIISSTIIMGSFIVITFSYIQIVWTICVLPSKQGMQKALSTCSSHLVVVFIYYGSGIYMYVRPNSYKTLETNKLVALLYAVLTPLLNPIIYSFRNNDVIKAVGRFKIINIIK